VTDDTADLDRLLARLAAEGYHLEDPNEHPAAEKLAAYQANELSPEENDAIQEHVTNCSLCAERLLDLQRFLEFAPEGQPREGVADLAAAAEWRELRQRVPGSSRIRRAFGSLKAAYGLAAVLAVGVMALSTYTWRLRQEIRGPEMNLRLVFLPSITGARGSEDLVKEIALAPRDEARITFSLEAPRTASFPTYRLVVKDPEGRLIWAGEGLRREDGLFVFTLPAQGLPTGRYSIEVSGLQGKNLPPVEVGRYGFKIRRS
jgi:Putative zinc-finger